jgi:hypothetical protein
MIDIHCFVAFGKGRNTSGFLEDEALSGKGGLTLTTGRPWRKVI